MTSYRQLAGRVLGYTPREGYNTVGDYFVQASNGARTVRTTMPRRKFLGMQQHERDAWLREARAWTERGVT